MRIDIRPAIYPDVEKLSLIKVLAKHQDEANSVMLDFETAYISGLLDERRIVFVLLCDRVPVAFCAARECMRKPFLGYALISDLYVLPEYQHNGNGRKLLSHTLRRLRGDGYMNAVLETAADNIAARRFYEKFGFVQSVKGASDGYAAYIIDF